MERQFVLIHSPLVGPVTWSLIADELRTRGHDAIVPTLHDAEDSDAPFWKQEVESVVPLLQRAGATIPMILVGHSGAGAFLPIVAQFTGRPVAAYLFVDAVLPLGGTSRLDEMTASAPELAAQLRRHLQTGGRYPEWTDEALLTQIPDDRLRRQMMGEIRPRPLAFFEEPIPTPQGWPDAPCGYLLFSPSYTQAAERARQTGWPCHELDGGHFHMLVDPMAVTDALVAMSPTD